MEGQSVQQGLRPSHLNTGIQGTGLTGKPVCLCFPLEWMDRPGSSEERFSTYSCQKHHSVHQPLLPGEKYLDFAGNKTQHVFCKSFIVMLKSFKVNTVN